MNFSSIFSVFARLLLLNAAVLLVPTAYAFWHWEASQYIFALTAALSFGLGGLLSLLPRRAANLDSIDGCAIAVFGWIIVALLGAFPYYFSSPYTTFTDAFFESISGFTTTGATIYPDVESLPGSILLWRSMTQWLGGMGIVVLVLAILPHFNSGSMNIFSAESPGPQTNKLTPRIQDTAKALWLLYLALTLLAFAYMLICGLSVFDAANHALTSISTGGFSTKNSGIAHFANPWLEWGMTFFMFTASINFVLHFGVVRRGRSLGHYLKNSELCFFVAILLLAIAGIMGAQVLQAGRDLGHGLVRETALQVVSIATSSGFYIADYTLWPVATNAILLALIIIGGCSGSSAGGFKVIRVLLVLKYVYIRMLRVAHPNVVRYVKIDRSQDFVEPQVLNGVISFLMVYWLVALFSYLLIAWDTANIETALSIVFSSLSNIGPALGEASGGVYANFSAFTKWVLSVNMLLGRLEFTAVLVFLFPHTWRR